MVRTYRRKIPECIRCSAPMKPVDEEGPFDIESAEPGEEGKTWGWACTNTECVPCDHCIKCDRGLCTLHEIEELEQKKSAGYQARKEWEKAFPELAREMRFG